MLSRTAASWRRQPAPLRLHHCRLEVVAGRRHKWTPQEPYIEEDPEKEEGFRAGVRRFVNRGRRLYYVGYRKWRTEERERSYGFERWDDYQTPFRRLRVWSFRSVFFGGSFRRLAFPDLAFIGTSSSLVVYYNTCRACRIPEEIEISCLHGFDIWTHPSMLLLPIEPFTLTSMSVGLLVAFRTQTCHQRFMEARTLWQQLANESRSLVSRILERVPSDTNGPCTKVVSVPQKRMEVVKWVRTLPHVLRYHLTADGGTFDHSDVELPSDPDEIRRLELEKVQRMREELAAIWDYIDPSERNCVERLFADEVFNRPLYVLHQISSFNSQVYGDFVGPPVAADYNRGVIAMHHVVGNCERLIQTPIYSPYTRAASRILFLYCNMLPLGLFPLVGPMGTVPLTIVISFFLLSSFADGDQSSKVCEAPGCDAVFDGEQEAAIHIDEEVALIQSSVAIKQRHRSELGQLQAGPCGQFVCNDVFCNPHGGQGVILASIGSGVVKTAQFKEGVSRVVTDQTDVDPKTSKTRTWNGCAEIYHNKVPHDIHYMGCRRPQQVALLSTLANHTKAELCSRCHCVAFSKDGKPME